MKKSLQITLNDNTTLSLESIVLLTTDSYINSAKLLDASSIPLLIQIQHQQLNTLLDCTKVAPYAILYFDEKLLFSGASFSLNASDSPFIIQTQCKTILFIPLNQKLEINNLLNCKKITIVN